MTVLFEANLKSWAFTAVGLATHAILVLQLVMIGCSIIVSGITIYKFSKEK